MAPILIVLLALATPDQARPPQRRPVPAPGRPHTTALTLADMANKQAVVNTSAGTFVIDLKPELAPNHAGYFIKLAREGAYDGTVFHRIIRHGIIQGGDPLSKDPAKAGLYGTGGLGMLKAELSGERATRGAVAAVIQPGKPDSAGAQFFVCVSDQPALDGKYTIFARVSEGMDVVTKISETETSSDGKPLSRVAIVSMTIRDTPPAEPDPFSTETAAQLGAYRVVLDTSAGPITVELFADKAPEHVRNFLRLAQAGVYDGTAFHRVVKGFAVQTGSVTSRGPLTEKQQKFVGPLKPEFNDTKHVKGIVSMARGDDPGSATTSFFIVTAAAPTLDGKYTAFGRVVEGLAAVDAIEQAPVTGEAPVTRIDLKSVRVVAPSK
ncbi:MAG TPA: peptidylprolyl isomerase [Vicinamibacterales bacterium]|nr:peptidylprolyl isomerase [Vicinamibacterales bacterium]